MSEGGEICREKDIGLEYGEIDGDPVSGRGYGDGGEISS
jgi:hypothetical protein